MEKIFFILFLINNVKMILPYQNPAVLNSNFPFSYKINNNVSVIFMEDDITLFDVTKTIDGSEPLIPHNLVGENICKSGEEKGGIFANNYYYTSCLKEGSKSNFVIKVYNKDFIIKSIYDNGYNFTSGTIRFFKKNGFPEMVGVSWINGVEFNMLKINHTHIKQYRHYPVSHMARDIDCIFISNHSRIVCLFGIEIDEQYTCSVNIFTYNDYDDNIFSSNLKTWYVCTNHQSRKIRADTDRNINSDIFYYYFVDTNNDAYIIQMQMTNPVEIKIGKVLLVMRGCDENQHSFDMAEDKFMGYNVFICVEYKYKKRIKIQLFKIENDQIIFYENKDVNNPYEYDDEFNSEISMINFIVLKDTLNFGFLSYRTLMKDKDYYTIFNQPECLNYEVNMMPGILFQNKPLMLNFDEVIKNDNYEGGKVEIVSSNPGMDLIVNPTGTKVEFISRDYITGIIEFTFRIRNDFYASEICIAKIEVKNCFQNCHTCSEEGEGFLAQLCEGCKEEINYYPISNFPLNVNDNCCQKDVDCPDYLYLDTDHYEICSTSCLACNGGNEDNCVTCYNQNELKNYTILEQQYIGIIKDTTTEFYWENEERKKCVNREGELYIYLDEESWTYMPCYKSCETCNGKGIPTNHNCKRCYEDKKYFHFENKFSKNCFKEDEDEVFHYFLFDDNYNPSEAEQSRFWKKCYNLCYTCIGGNNNDCTSCETGSYPKCEEKEKDNFQCFDSLPESNYFFDIDNNCYEKCDKNCLTCDKSPEYGINNCLTCKIGQIIFNKNCYDNCPETHYELDHKKCVYECPPYAPFKLTYSGERGEYKQCYNCAEIGKCVYLGTKKSDPLLKGDCVSCNLEQTFLSNEDYGILDDCYDLCDTCIQSGTVEQMNCNTCKYSNYCLVKGYGNCVKRGEEVDFYYMAIESGICVYNKCYKTCKSCSGEGNDFNHKCLLCKDKFQFDLNNPGNCVELCDYYWYINLESNQLTCLNETKCPDNNPYLVKLTKQCVSNCFYAYYNGANLLFRYKNTCLDQCPDNTMTDKILFACYPLDDLNDVFNYATNYISSSTNVNNLLIYSSNRKKFFHLFNTTDLGIRAYIQSSNNVGTSIIDFSNCIATFKEKYDFNDDEIFYIGILDVLRDDTSAPQFEYIIHNHLGIKLSNDFCLNNEIIVNKSLIHKNDTFLAKDTLNKYDIDITDYDNEKTFFCDICYYFDYNELDPYDILLNDRYKYYYKEPDFYFCENSCKSELTLIDINNSRVQCVCNGKNNYTDYKDEDFQQFEKSSRKCSDWFMQYLKCYKNVFNKDLLGNNIGFYFILFFILFQILSLLIFFLISKKPIMKHIRQALLIKMKKRNDMEEMEFEKDDIIQVKRNGSQKSSLNKGQSKNSSNKNSKTNIKKRDKKENKNKDKKSNNTGSSGRSMSKHSSSQKSDSYSDSYSGSKNIRSNPPKNEKNEYKFISDNNNQNKKSNNIYNINTDKNNKNINNISNIKNDKNNLKNKEGKNNKTENKGAPKTLFQRYAKIFLKNRKDYVDDSYRESSYDFDISKIPRSKRIKIEDIINNEEENEESEIIKNDDGKNNDIKNEKEKEKEKDKTNENKNEKEENKKEKNEGLPPAKLPKKSNLDELKEEIKKFKKLSFLELYLFIIKKRHRIISLFIKKDVYDIFSIKFSLLILSYIIDFFITTLLFFDFEIRYLFYIKKHIDPYYTIFMGIINTLISTALMRVIDYFVEFRKKFKSIEKGEQKVESNNSYFNALKEMMKSLKIKIIIYYTITFIFSLIVWYIVSAFIGTYINIKLQFLLMIGLNFGLSNIFPFIYYLIIVALQYIGINKKKYKLFQFAMIMLKI